MVVGNMFTVNSLAGDYHQPRSKLIGEDALLSIGSALLGGLFGSSNNSANNATQLQIARENNAFNERMFDRQIAYNWDMFNAENKYNSASEQVKRYIAAGINPALAMENQSAATAQGGSVSPPSASSMPNTQAYDPSMTFNRVSEILYNDAMRQKELRMKDAEIAGKEAENAFNVGYYDVLQRQNEQQLKNQVLAGLISQNEYNEAISSWNIRRRTLENTERNQRLQGDYQSSMIQAQNLENQLKTFHLKNAPAEFKAQMALLGAQTAAAVASGVASYAEAQRAYQDRAESISRQFGIDLDNRKKESLFRSSVFAERAKNYSEAAQSINERFHAQDKTDFLYGNSFGQRMLRRGAQTADYLSQPIKGLLRIGK